MTACVVLDGYDRYLRAVKCRGTLINTGKKSKDQGGAVKKRAGGNKFVTYLEELGREDCSAVFSITFIAGDLHSLVRVKIDRGYIENLQYFYF